MATNRIPLQAVLSPSESETIDKFCSANRGIESLPRLAGFLEENFGLDISLDPDVVVGFASDSSNLPGEAQGLCRPASERDCAVILRACFRSDIPVTLSGGRSNLTGSATPQGGMVVSTIKMAEPEVRVDRAGQTTPAPMGMMIEDLRNLVRRQTDNALIFPVDPTSRAEASIGGSLSCNASGFTPGVIGSFRPWVDSVRFLLPDGLLIAAPRGAYRSADGVFLLAQDGAENAWLIPRYPRPAIKNAGGPFSAPDGVMDFVDLVIGSEGIFGMVTACTLKLTSCPTEHLDLFFSLPEEAQAVAFLHCARDHFGGDLSCVSALEYFGANCRNYMKHEERFFHGDDPVAVYIQEPLFERELEEAAETWLELLERAACAVDDEAIILLDTEQLRALFLEARHSLPANALEVVQQRGTFTIMTDTVVPPDRFAEFLEYTHGLLAAENLDYLSFGHLGDCHLHFTILPEPEQLEKGAAAYDAIVAKSAELGGVYSGEHGTGKRKRKDFLRCYGPEGVEQVRRCKVAVDPNFLLNRGNVFAVEQR